MDIGFMEISLTALGKPIEKELSKCGDRLRRLHVGNCHG